MIRPVVSTEVDSRSIMVYHTVDIDIIADSLIIFFVCKIFFRIGVREINKLFSFLIGTFFMFAVLYHGNILFFNFIIGLNEIVGELFSHFIESPVFAVEEYNAFLHVLCCKGFSAGKKL